jgi:GDP-L-fucose synthase
MLLTFDYRLFAVISAKRLFAYRYVEDAAEGIVLATEHYYSREPVNLGSGREISILDLAVKIAGMTGFRGQVRWDKTKPNGQPRRCLDVSRAERAFGFRAKTSFEDELRKTIDWYLSCAQSGETQ